jgi:uncharacterized protein YbcI
VVTLRGALSPAELALARGPAGAALLQEFHRALFASACGTLQKEIERIAGAAVREAAQVHEPTGIVVQVFRLAGSVPAETWSGTAPGD